MILTSENGTSIIITNKSTLNCSNTEISIYSFFAVFSHATTFNLVVSLRGTKINIWEEYESPYLYKIDGTLNYLSNPQKKNWI